MKLNINDQVIVKLTPAGFKTYKEYWNNWAVSVVEQPDDPIKMTLWGMMHIFGPQCEQGEVIPFVDGEIDIVEKTGRTTNMDYQQMFRAITALDYGANIGIRQNGEWYLNSSIDRKEGGCLSRGLTAGKIPEEAINQFWGWATDPKYYLILKAFTPERRAVRWNGFMWEDVIEDIAATEY